MVVVVTIVGARAVRASCATPGSAFASAPARSISKPFRRSASMCACCARSISPSAIFLAGLSGVLAGGSSASMPTMGDGLLMPSFIAIIVGGVGSLPGTLIGGLLIGVASGVTAVFLPAGERGGDVRADGGGAARAPARAPRRRRHADVMGRRPDCEPASRSSLIWVVLADSRRSGCRSVGGYTALGDARARARPRRDVDQFPARLHRLPVVRPRRLFRPRRLWRRLDAEIPGREHAAVARCSARCSAGVAGALLGAADRASARRLFRDGHDRLRPGLLLHRLSLEHPHRRR